MNELIRILCNEFALDYHQITVIEQVEMLYVYNKIAEEVGDDPDLVARRILQMRKELDSGGKTRSLYTLFRHLQAQSMTQSGNYDLDTLRPPVVNWRDTGIY